MKNRLKACSLSGFNPLSAGFLFVGIGFNRCRVWMLKKKGTAICEHNMWHFITAVPLHLVEIVVFIPVLV
jgi:hypothetical protein